ncbi:MAG: sugar translocase [Pseudomonadota bacterium]
MQKKNNYCSFLLSLFGVALSFSLATLVLHGWPNFIPPTLSEPYIYAGDGLSMQWLAQRSIEGWIFENHRSGYPYGSNFYDYPMSDSGHFLLLKILGLVFGSASLAVNLHFLLSFSVTFLVTFLILKKFQIQESIAFGISLLFAFAPFHFARFFYGHILYTWYFSVPVFFYLGYKIASNKKIFNGLSLKKATILSMIFVALSSFGVYFAFFGSILLLTSGILGSIKIKKSTPFKASLGLTAGIFLGVLLNLMPNILEFHNNGRNQHVAQRSPIESEIYSLKVMHLIIPHPDHRIKQARDFSRNYKASFPLSNTVSSLGVIGILGLASIFIAVLFMAANREVDSTVRFTSIAFLVLLLFAIPGGLSTIFAIFVTPLIRGWDRISIFINFACLLTLAVILNNIFSQLRAKKYNVSLKYIAVIAVTATGIIDQTPSSYASILENSAANYRIDSGFIKEIEENSPPEAAIYQLPHIDFPEAPPKHQLHSYQLATGFINSKSLKWSFGGVKGREGDSFFKHLALQPASVQITELKKLGFHGVYIDKRGYPDGGLAIVQEFSMLLGEPSLTRSDGNVVFFTLSNPDPHE